MIQNKEWLGREAKEWTKKGWITEEAQEQIISAYGGAEKKRMSLSLYTIAAIVGGAFIGMALIWLVSTLWYHAPIAARVAVAVLLLLISQGSVGLAMFQKQEGTLLGEGIALIHGVIVFVVLALMEQTFYIGWDGPSYVAAGAILMLPAAYLLRSIGSIAAYDMAVLVWAIQGGMLNAVGGAAFFWVLVMLPLPFYGVLVANYDEKRLSIFSWIMTITVFLAFGLVAQRAAYIPFLMMAALAVAVMLVGYTIDIQKSWGVPFRWFGRFVAVVSLMISCMPSSWNGIADIQGFHWTTITVTVLLMAASIVLLAKGVKKRLWGPAIYTAIPFLLGMETLLVRSGLYSSIPLIASSLYLLFLGFFEALQGFNHQRITHIRFGGIILIGLVISFFVEASFSPLVPIVAIIVLLLVIVQYKRTTKSRKDAALRRERRSKLTHTTTTLRRKARIERQEAATADTMPYEESPLAAKNAADDADTLAEWMKDIHVPKVDHIEARTEADRKQGTTVMPRVQAQSQFVPPVFHAPDDIPVAPVQPSMSWQKAATHSEPKKNKPMSSPWQSMAQQPAKRERHFTKSPWATEGDTKR